VKEGLSLLFIPKEITLSKDNDFVFPTAEITECIEALASQKLPTYNAKEFEEGRRSAIKTIFGIAGMNLYTAALHRVETAKIANIESGKKTIFYPAYHVMVTEGYDRGSPNNGNGLVRTAQYLDLPCRWARLESENNEGKRIVVVVDGIADEKKLAGLTFDHYYSNSSGRKDGKLWWVVEPTYAEVQIGVEG
jgi:hypothetical protein